MSTSRLDVVTLMNAGVDGYLTKSTHSEDLVDLLESALAGNKPVSKEVAGYLLDIDDEIDTGTGIERLTPREREVVNLIARGYTYRETAATLEISVKTLETHMSHIFEKLGIASRDERVQAMESVLELPGSVGRFVRVPGHDQLPRGPLATTRLDDQLLRLGLATADQLVAPPEPEEYQPRRTFDEDRVWVLTLADKLRLQFDYDFPGVHDVRIQPVWAAGEVLQFGGDFNNYITSKHLQKQEGVIFRHLLRLILLVGELSQLCPPDTTEEEWQGDLQDIAERLTESCREVDPTSTEKALEQAQAASDASDV